MPSDTIWRQKSGSTLAQVMACCLTASSHYLNQCWFTISKVHWHSFEYNFTRDTSAVIHWISLKITDLKFHSNLPGANELNHWGQVMDMCIRDPSNHWRLFGTEPLSEPMQKYCQLDSEEHILTRTFYLKFSYDLEVEAVTEHRWYIVWSG